MNFDRPASIRLFKNVLLFSGGVILFLAGCIIYGIILNIREKTLDEEMTLKGIKELNDVNLVIYRSKYELDLYTDTILVKRYRAVFGRNNQPKTRLGDRATPIGEYRICKIDSNHIYHRILKLNYPNLEDATEGLRKGIINQKEYEKLRFAFYYGDCVNDTTQLGVNIGIHGIGKLNYVFKNLPFVFNWTNGSIALSNENIDEIISVIKNGTKVIIKI